jgi:hypothetical protein
VDGVRIARIAALLAAAFGSRGIFEPKFFAFIVLPGIMGLALAWPIWRQRIWAMLAVLAIAILLTFVFSMETGAITRIAARNDGAVRGALRRAFVARESGLNGFQLQRAVTTCS